MPMNTSEVTERVAALIGVEPTSIDESAAIHELVKDSIEIIEVSLDLQDHFDILFTHDDLGQVETIGDLVELIRART